MPTDKDVKPSVEEVVRDQLETVGFRLADMADIPDADCVEVLMTVEQLCERVSDRMEALEARALTAEARLAEAVEALRELDAVLGDTPMPDCATMNRLIAASSRARAIAEQQGG